MSNMDLLLQPEPLQSEIATAVCCLCHTVIHNCLLHSIRWALSLRFFASSPGQRAAESDARFRYQSLGTG